MNNIKNRKSIGTTVRMIGMSNKVLEELLKRAAVAGMLIASLSSAPTGRAQPDAVTEWNAIAVQALTTASPPRPGPVFFLDMAIVQTAVHDAVQAIEKEFTPYYVEIPDAAGSPVAAAIAAAHAVLVGIVPGQMAALDAAYGDSLADNGLDPDDPGVVVGEAAAAGLLSLRGNDGRVPNPLPPPYTGGTDPGEWRPTPSLQLGPPPSLAPMATPWLGSVPTFAVKGGEQFRATPPPPVEGKRYAQDYQEVKALGSLFNSARTSEQTALAYFYGGNLPILFHNILRGITETLVDAIGDRARLLALANLAIADSLITCWDSKLYYSFWRPITAIREGQFDGNPATDGDPAWQPFLNTPNYPDHTSGANAVAGALTRTLALFFGTDEGTFFVTSNHPLADPSVRLYHRFSDLARDIVEVRIYHGLHFRTADTQGRKQGRLVAQWTFGHFLRPLGESAEDSTSSESNVESALGF